MDDRSSLENIIECLIFVSKHPLTIQEISGFLKDVEKKEITDALDKLQKALGGDGTKFRSRQRRRGVSVQDPSRVFAIRSRV